LSATRTLATSSWLARRANTSAHDT
jgi:hypothetical protein